MALGLRIGMGLSLISNFPCSMYVYASMIRSSFIESIHTLSFYIETFFSVTKINEKQVTVVHDDPHDPLPRHPKRFYILLVSRYVLIPYAQIR